MTEVEPWRPPAPAAPSSALARGTSDKFQHLLAAFLLGYEGNTHTPTRGTYFNPTVCVPAAPPT